MAQLSPRIEHDLVDAVMEQLKRVVATLGTVAQGQMEMSAEQTRLARSFIDVRSDTGDIKLRLNGLESSLDRRFGDIEKRFGDIEKRFDAVDRRFEKIESQLAGMLTRFEDVERQIDDQHRALAAFRAEVAARFDTVDKRMDAAVERLAGVEQDLEKLARVTSSMHTEVVGQNLQILNAVQGALQASINLEDVEARVVEIEKRLAT